MKHLFTCLTLAFTLLISGQVYAQQIPVFSQYIYNPYLYNPGRAGADDLGNVYLSGRRQWTSMPDAPITQTLTFDTPIKDGRSGIGATAFVDNTHIITKLGIMGSYAYRFKFDEEGTHSLGAGLSVGLLHQRVDIENATVEDVGDPALLNGDNLRRTVFDASFGIHYRFKRLNVDVSIPQITNTDVIFRNQTGSTSTYDLLSHYLASVRYKFGFGESKISLEPVAILRATAGLPVQVDGNLVLDWNDRVWFSLGYRSNTAAVNGGLGVRIHDKLSATYTFEMPPRKDDRTGLGYTHEILLGFRFGGELKKLRKRADALEQGLAEANGRIDQNANDIEDLEKEVDENRKKIEQNKEKLLEHEVQLEVHDDDIETLKSYHEKKKSLRRIKVGTVYFNRGSDKLTASAKSKLQALMQSILTRADGSIVDVAGHTSAEGGSDYNRRLAQRRAMAVRDYLNDLGLPPSAMTPVSYGEDLPVTVTQNTEEDRVKNRRVEVYILTE